MNKWVQKLGMKKGGLSGQLGIPVKKNIPVELLNKVIRARAGQTITNPTSTGHQKIKVTRLLEQRAILARTLKKMSRR